MDPLYLASIGTQVLISACVCFMVIKLGLCSSDRNRRLLLLLLAASLSMLTLHFEFANGFPISGSPYLQLPGALYVLLPVFAIICCLFNLRIERPNLISAFFTAALVLGMAHYLCFPWGLRGSNGWIAFALITLGGAVYVASMQSLGNDKPRSAIIWWAAHNLCAVPLLLSLIAVGHIEILFLAITPIAIMGFVSWFMGQAVFQMRLSLFLGVMLAALLGNAAMRYVPSSSDPAFITWIIRLSPLALIGSALVIATSLRKQSPINIIGASVAALFLIGASALCVYAYNYEDPNTESSGNEWDYNNL